MKTNPILDEIQSIKDQLARKAGGEMSTFCDQLRVWEQGSLPSGFFVISPGNASLFGKQKASVLKEKPEIIRG